MIRHEMTDEQRRNTWKPGPQPFNQIAATLEEQMKRIDIFRQQAAERRRREEIKPNGG